MDKVIRIINPLKIMDSTSTVYTKVNWNACHKQYHSVAVVVTIDIDCVHALCQSTILSIPSGVSAILGIWVGFSHAICLKYN